MHHHLAATPDTVLWGHIDPAAAPVLRIDSGDSVTIQTLSGGARNLPAPGSGCHALPAHRQVIARCRPHLGPHILTGPIFVRDAAPGDRLLVEIEEITLAQDFGWNAIEPGFGILPDVAEDYQSLTIPLDRARRQARLPWGPVVDLAPFFGILAVAPGAAGGCVGSVAPGPFGGNMDNRYCRAGARIALPVFCEGALFLAGDGHALQGDGEICDTALETALDGRLRFCVEKGTAPEAPEILCDNRIITMDFDEDLNTAATTAARRMVDWLARNTALSVRDAYRHCSLLADLRVTQMVNRRKGAHCVLDLGTLPAGA
ncbi:acetamidase [Paracoccus mutanolyticus]|uniref:Acetamidase n=1 Tax=Paracoccus mutanolyticus TaxID=1499308 RepID=A0ABM6WUD6_9RHOB|nr:acetamidase/formamidase family protein [Paracoccus mutanolyticus]AWX94271.1 acetamidase [Paracoccus mutanolyticus]